MEMVWRLLRLQPVPYFVLGASRNGTALRFRVTTPFDHRRRFEFKDLELSGEPAGQPVVRWTATYRDQLTDRTSEVAGHVQVRWSHGRFGKNPEAKVYLDTEHHAVPGYVPLGLGRV